MKHNFFKLKTYLLMGFCISIGLSACEESHDDLGVDIHPDNERLLVFNDSLAPVKVYSVLTSHEIYPTTSYALLGHIIDPLIGGYKSSFIANARPRVLSIDLGDTILLDSMFIYIKYDTVYGDYNHEHIVSVYEMYRDSSKLVENLYGKSDDISSISDYYDPSSLLVQGAYTPEARSADSVVISAIKLDLLETDNGKDLAQRILFSNDTLYSYLNYVQQYIFNGLYFEAETRTEAGGIIRVDTDSTRLSVYYKKLSFTDSTNTEYDTTEQTLNFELYSLGRANIYERDQKPDLPIFTDTLVEPEYETIDSTFYIHGVNGIDARLVVDIKSLFPDSTPVAINRAIISIQAEDSTFLDADTYQVLPGIAVYADDADAPYLSEFLVSNGQGGYSYSSVPYYNGAYTFAVTSRVVKTYNEGLDKFVLKLISSQNHTNPSRVALKGVGNKSYPVKIKITYTIFNNN